MPKVALERQDHVAVVRLDRGVINAIDLEVVEELAGAWRRLRDDPEVHGLVLGTTNDKFFSIGLDIPWLYDLGREAFVAFYRAFNRMCLDLYVLPKPTVAAVAGHAIAGGCILALCCDYRLVAGGRTLMGLNEVRLGVPVPYPADGILRDLVGARQARDIMETGDFFEPERLLALGLVDRVAPRDQVLPWAIEKASALGEWPRDAFTVIKRNRVEAVEARVRDRLEQKERQFIDCWFAPEARQRLQAAMATFCKD
jgi:enoyl-CoA hydratase/carnithine racemase